MVVVADDVDDDDVVVVRVLFQKEYLVPNHFQLLKRRT